MQRAGQKVESKAKKEKYTEQTSKICCVTRVPSLEVSSDFRASFYNITILTDEQCKHFT